MKTRILFFGPVLIVAATAGIAAWARFDLLTFPELCMMAWAVLVTALCSCRCFSWYRKIDVQQREIRALRKYVAHNSMLAVSSAREFKR